MGLASLGRQRVSLQCLAYRAEPCSGDASYMDVFVGVTVSVILRVLW